MTRTLKTVALSVGATCSAATLALAAEISTNSLVAPDVTTPAEPPEQAWNWHAQNTDIVQYHPAFPASYSGPNSLSGDEEVKETVSVDLYAGARLWRGAEAHIDVLAWQGFGFSKTLGIEAFPNGEAFRLGTDVPNVNIARLFLRQTIGLGGGQEAVEDGPLQLAGQQDVSRLTLTVGRYSAKDIFDNNAYANDPRTQFMNWALMVNEAWDYPADSLGYISGFAAELNQPHWAVRYGFFQMPEVANGTAVDSHVLEAWGMVTEFERRYALNEHPGVVRFLAFLNSAHMGSYQEAVDSPVRPRRHRGDAGLSLQVWVWLERRAGDHQERRGLRAAGLERRPDRGLDFRPTWTARPRSA